MDGSDEMPKISDVAAEDTMSPDRKVILDYLNTHNEIFRATDSPELAKKLGLKPWTPYTAMVWLCAVGALYTIHTRRGMYYGSKKAIYAFMRALPQYQKEMLRRSSRVSKHFYIRKVGSWARDDDPKPYLGRKTNVST
jgi:hypothetical protein